MEEHAEPGNQEPLVTVGGAAIDLTPRPARAEQQAAGLQVSLEPGVTPPRPQGRRPWPGIRDRGQVLLLISILLATGLILGILLDRQLARRHR